MTTLAFFLEGPSEKAFLEGLVPRIVPEDILVHYVVFRGKQDMAAQLEKKIKGWQTPDTRIVVLRDQDAADCKKVKGDLQAICRAAQRPDALVRIACHELESFYLGDLAAVESGLGLKGVAKLQKKKKYKNPDRLVRPSEELQTLTRKQYQKIGGSRAIAPHLRLDGNKSASFRALVSGLRKVTRDAAQG